MDFVRAPTMRKKKPEQAGALESKASWVVHKPPTDMPPASTRAEGSAQEAGAQAPGGRGSSTETLPTPRLLQSSESTSSSSESVGQRPAPPPKTYSDVVGMLDQAGAAPPGQPIPAPRFTPSSAQRRPSIDRRLSEPGASSDATSADESFTRLAKSDGMGERSSVGPLRIKRSVDVFVWKEQERKVEKQEGGRTRTYTVYEYEREWVTVYEASDIPNSNRFKHAAGHHNPFLKVHNLSDT